MDRTGHVLTFQIASLMVCKNTFGIIKLEIRVSRSDTYHNIYKQVKSVHTVVKQSKSSQKYWTWSVRQASTQCFEKSEKQ